MIYADLKGCDVHSLPGRTTTKTLLLRRLLVTGHNCRRAIISLSKPIRPVRITVPSSTFVSASKMIPAIQDRIEVGVQQTPYIPSSARRSLPFTSKLNDISISYYKASSSSHPCTPSLSNPLHNTSSQPLGHVTRNHLPRRE